jgi:hypothetical protein
MMRAEIGCPFFARLAICCHVLFSGGISSARNSYIFFGLGLKLPFVSVSFCSLANDSCATDLDHSLKLVVESCSPSCHNIGRCLGCDSLPAIFRAARPSIFRHLPVGSVNSSCRLTRHAADGGYVPRLLSFFWLPAGSVSRANPPSHPPQLMPTVRQFLSK